MVQFLTYVRGDKVFKYPYRVSYFAIQKTSEEIKEKTGMEFSIEDLGAADLSVLEPLLYYSIVAGIHFTQSDMKISREEIMWVLDQCMMEFTSGIPKFFPEAKVGSKGKK